VSYLIVFNLVMLQYKYMKINKSGFTLIELLVVIAIIGILAAVVLASLNDARKSGSSSSVQQSLSSAKSQAEIVYNANGVYSYAEVCNDAKIQQLLNAAAKAGGVDADQQGSFETGGTYAVDAAWDLSICRSQSDAWVIQAPLANSTSASSSLWCVDSVGFSGVTSTAVAGASTISCS
jgi:prepilin-type N-terminal cleavage/methylation domain-containing protein